jgi:hypothetical protein
MQSPGNNRGQHIIHEIFQLAADVIHVQIDSPSLRDSRTDLRREVRDQQLNNHCDTTPHLAFWLAVPT